MAKGKYQQWLTEDGLLLLKGWARDGLTDEQIANNCGVSRSTLSEWKRKFSDISDALKRGKEVVDYEVENALYRRALGYEYEETQTTIEETPSGTRRKVIKIKKHMPPDTTAIAIWINNRMPQKWRRNANKERLDEDKFEHEKEIDAKKHWV